ncbi:hypothetical protein B9Z55_005148 [Caenorhabditis nigoni]|uniref:VWFA domain-containing protein n=1 Tax=Caenorhabditis nigoni TaxID=1611254 RepID=A0A2G5UZM9_9PELO|nr:hypothetical protein B9Z55_005148 [Caenorhabditis nigoni]
MTQTETYDLQNQRMAASSGNGKIFGRFDPIHIALAVISVIFLILSIVFIILFATKHDTSTGFLATGFSDSKSGDVSSELKGLLNKKYTVNSFALDVQNKAVSAVFSLRDDVSTKDVQSVLSGSKLVTQLETTYGDKATAVCRQQPAASIISTSLAPATSAPTNAPPVTGKYCNNNAITRDIVIVVDMNDLPKNDHTEKMNSLAAIRDSLTKGITFPDAKVFLKAVVAGDVIDVSTKWISDSATLTADFNKLLAINNFNNQSSLIIADVFTKSFTTLKTGRQFVPGALFIVTDKQPSSDSKVAVNPRDSGIYIGFTGVRKSYIDQYSTWSDSIVTAESWTDLGKQDPFGTLVCSFYKLPAAPKAEAFFNYPLGELDAADTPKCQVLDIIIAFDISESLSRIILPKYVAFAKRLVAQYKYKANDFTRVGVLTFNDQVTEKLTLVNGNNLDAVNAAIDSVQYVGGLTDVTKALKTAQQLFQTESDASRSKVLIVLSDAVPTVDTYTDEIQAGKQLSAMGVATFFIGYNHYSDDVKKELGQVTNPNYVFGDMSDASFNGVTTQILTTYPCPKPKCVTAYYAIEISEATDDDVVDNLKDILLISSQAKTLQTGTESYQLITYNDIGNTQINPKGDASFDAFQKYVQALIDNPNQVAALRRGYTRLDKAIDDVTAELKNQATKNSRFSGNIIFMGQANDAVLNPNVPEAQKIVLLQASAASLKAQTAGLIFVVDDSRNTADFGDDLWTSVTTKNRIVQKADDVVAALKGTDYFQTWKALSCSLPARTTCYDTPLDVAVIIDLQKKDDYVFLNYITSLLSQFSSQDDTHISMLAYGARKTSVLSSLSAHSSAEVQNFAVVYTDWSNGTYFMTTTTEAPTTTQKPKNIFTNDLYQVDQGMMNGYVYKNVQKKKSSFANFLLGKYPPHSFDFPPIRMDLSASSERREP